jgi:Ca2+-binding EF-hand superfamily protein
MLKEADENDDGKITRAEIDKSIETRFGKADANKDGALDEKEFSAAMPKPPEPPKPPADAPKPPKFDPSVMFKRADWNGDGKITPDEFAIPIRAMAMHADRNGDGAVSDDDRPGPPPR